MSMDNYSYLIQDERSGTAILVDPADPDPVMVSVPVLLGNDEAPTK